MKHWTEQDFEKATGRPHEQDDLDRCNCLKAGELSHRSCGICANHGLPVFECHECFVSLANTASVERISIDN